MRRDDDDCWDDDDVRDERRRHETMNLITAVLAIWTLLSFWRLRQMLKKQRRAKLARELLDALSRRAPDRA